MHEGFQLLSAIPAAGLLVHDCSMYAFIKKTLRAERMILPGNIQSAKTRKWQEPLFNHHRPAVNPEQQISMKEPVHYSCRQRRNTLPPSPFHLNPIKQIVSDTRRDQNFPMKFSG